MKQSDYITAAERKLSVIIPPPFLLKGLQIAPTLLANHTGFRAENLGLDPLCRLRGRQFGKRGDAGRTRSLSRQPRPEPR